MPLRNGPTGYGVVTKTLHWLTGFLLAIQFAVGYGLEAVSAWLTGTDDSDADEAAVFVHGWLGGAILLVAAIRLGWRLTTPLPPWSERLSEADRRLAHRTEQVLYLLLFVTPASGLALLLLSGEERDIAEDREWRPPYALVEDDLLLAAHVVAHLTFYVALAVHIGLAVRRGTLARMV
ncbi:MAG TPA: cytochrome b/b6 domain-containing protein [Natronosporangium sp.]